ncbi:hypothetical protein MD484_g5492, partial [Candolleomyces efflorescens]
MTRTPIIITLMHPCDQVPPPCPPCPPTATLDNAPYGGDFDVTTGSDNINAFGGEDETPGVIIDDSELGSGTLDEAPTLGIDGSIVSDIAAPAVVAIGVASCLIGLQQLAKIVKKILDTVEKVKELKKELTWCAGECKALLEALARQYRRISDEELKADIEAASKILISLHGFARSLYEQSRIRRFFNHREHARAIKAYRTKFEEATRLLIIKSVVDTRRAIHDELNPKLDAIRTTLDTLCKGMVDQNAAPLPSPATSSTYQDENDDGYESEDFPPQPQPRSWSGSRDWTYSSKAWNSGSPYGSISSLSPLSLCPNDAGSTYHDPSVYLGVQAPGYFNPHPTFSPSYHARSWSCTSVHSFASGSVVNNINSGNTSIVSYDNSFNNNSRTYSESSRPELSAEDRKLLRKGTRLGKVARYTGNALNIMLTVLKEASAGVPILRPVAGSALAALETVQMMDDNHGLIAQILVDVVETSYVVTLALQTSDQGQEQIVEQKLLTYIQTFDAKLQGIHEALVKLLKPKGGVFSRITQVKGYKNTINDLHESLKKERANLHLLITTLTYCGVRGSVSLLPVDHESLKRLAEEKANMQLQDWQQVQPGGPGSGAVVNSQVGHMTAKKARGNAVGTQGTIVNGDGFRGTNTLNHITRVEMFSIALGHNTKIGTVGNYNSGDVHGNMNQGCNFFGPGHQSQEPGPQPGWQQQWSQGAYSSRDQPHWQPDQWEQAGYSPQHQQGPYYQ